MRSFVKIKFSRNGEITLSLTDISKPCPKSQYFYTANMSFNAIRENKILAKISEFAVAASLSTCDNLIETWKIFHECLNIN